MVKKTVQTIYPLNRFPQYILLLYPHIIMIRFPYILNVKYPYGTQHYYSITLSWCCVHVEIRVDVGSDITSHYLSHITLSIIEIMVDVRNDN